MEQQIVEHVFKICMRPETNKGVHISEIYNFAKAQGCRTVEIRPLIDELLNAARLYYGATRQFFHVSNIFDDEVDGFLDPEVGWE